MANKFLGLDSINVLKQYIDEQIISVNNNTRVVTIQAYKSWNNGINDVPATPSDSPNPVNMNIENTPEVPTGGGFDTNAVTVVYPEGWYSLYAVMQELSNKYEGDLEEALMHESIYMSAGVAAGTDNIVWSKPMKISGQNGISVKFLYAYDNTLDPNEEILSDKFSERPHGVDAENRIEYVWIWTDKDGWSNPTIWAMYVQDASDVLWRYCVTATDEVPAKPSVNDPKWMTSISSNLSHDYPYMWMCWKRVPAGMSESGAVWSDPILFGHYGNIPDYTLNLYKSGEGYIQPEKPILGEYNEETESYEFENLDLFRAENSSWLDLPIDEVIEDEKVEYEYVGVDSYEAIMNNLNSGKVLKLINDLDLESPIIINGENVTIDLNDYKLTGPLFIEKGGEVIPVDLTSKDKTLNPDFNISDAWLVNNEETYNKLPELYRSNYGEWGTPNLSESLPWLAVTFDSIPANELTISVSGPNDFYKEISYTDITKEVTLLTLDSTELGTDIVEGSWLVTVNDNTREIYVGTKPMPSDSYVFWVKGGKLTVIGNGEVIAQPTTYSIAVWADGGEVVLKGGKYYNGGDGCDLIYAKNGGKVYIYDGEYYATGNSNTSGATANNRSALNIYDKSRDICKIKVFGGKFYEFNPANNLSEGENTNFVDSDSYVRYEIGEDHTKTYIVSYKDPVKIWWQVVVKVNGKDNKVMSISDVKRYNAVDGTAKAGIFTKTLYCWSPNQNKPKIDFSNLINGWRPNGWYETMDYDTIESWTGDVNSIKSESSLWVISGESNGLDDNGHPIIQQWSLPIKISGPRGPISYDYRVVNKYMIGDAYKPKYLFESYAYLWTDNIPNNNELNDTYPYIYMKSFLMRYVMKHDDNGEVVPDNTIPPTLITDYGLLRLSGLNGNEAMSKNNVVLYSDNENKNITSFNNPNYYIFNNSEKVSVNIDLDQLTFTEGLTAKIANIGTSDITITSAIYKFIGSNKEIDKFVINPQDTIELICYKDENLYKLIVSGKALS